MAQNTGTGFEELTQRVFQALHDQQDARNVRVERDIELTGISGVSRNIDVYWEFELGGVTHRVIVECKDWARAVDLGVVTALLGTLSDLPGNLGAIVSRNGFQDGARRLAEAHRIVLYELRAPNDKDWDGFITGVNITGTFLVPELHPQVQFLVDNEWLDSERKRRGIAPTATLPSINGLAGELLIEREDGSTLATVRDTIKDHLMPAAPGPPEWREYLFPEIAYVVTGLPDLPRVRLRGLKVQMGMSAITQNIEVRLEPLVGLILKEVAKGTFAVLDAEGRPLGPG